ncbi:MAG: ankyrin repeat domain-containing protein [Rickettsiaceae bacterium]|nr:ankyrin repeat domain-containing protein [Rickettsiaceae bacterium]
MIRTTPRVINPYNLERCTPLLTSVKLRIYDTTYFLVTHGADVNVIDEESGNTPVMIAVQLNDIATIRLLLLADVRNINNTNCNGDSALIMAIERNNIDAAKLLLKNGADVNIKNGEGENLIALAEQQDNQEMIEILISHGAIVNHREVQEGSSADDVEYSNYVIIETGGASMVENDTNSS